MSSSRSCDSRLRPACCASLYGPAGLSAGWGGAGTAGGVAAADVAAGPVPASDAGAVGGLTRPGSTNRTSAAASTNSRSPTQVVARGRPLRCAWAAGWPGCEDCVRRMEAGLICAKPLRSGSCVLAGIVAIQGNGCGGPEASGAAPHGRAERAGKYVSGSIMAARVACRPPRSPLRRSPAGCHATGRTAVRRCRSASRCDLPALGCAA